MEISGILRDYLIRAQTRVISRTHEPFNVYSAQRLDLFARCVRLSRLLVGFRTNFKSLHFHGVVCFGLQSTVLETAKDTAYVTVDH